MNKQSRKKRVQTPRLPRDNDISRNKTLRTFYQFTVHEDHSRRVGGHEEFVGTQVDVARSLKSVLLYESAYHSL